MTCKPLKVWLTPLNIGLIYTILGGIWIFFSDTFFGTLLNDPALIQRAKILNHWIFIVVSGQALYWLIRHRDSIFEQSQKNLFEVNRALRFYSECNKAITWDRDESELLKKICRILVMLGNYRLAWVGFAQQDEEKTVRPVAFWGHDDGYLSNLKVTWGESETGQGPAGTTIRTGQTTVVAHITTNPQFRPWRDVAIQHGFEAAISLPLREGKTVWGALVILASEADAFNVEEVGLLEELADNLSSGIATIRKDAEQAKVKEEQLLLAAVIAQEAEGVMTFDYDGTIRYVNPAWASICGISAEQLIGWSLHDFGYNSLCQPLYQAMHDAVFKGESTAGRFICYRPDNTRFEIDARISPVKGLADNVVRYVAVIRDVTHEVQLEEQLRIAQKMEAVATLSGGIAHDFNNILAAIITNTELTLEDVSAQNNLHEYLEIVLQAALRGKNLVKQIKTISQQTSQERSPVRVEKIIEECLLLLRASLPTSIEIQKHIDQGIGMVAADPTQLHQVILNLCTNAAEAMQNNNGILDVRLEAFNHKASYEVDYPGLPTGNYLCLTISDTGHGIERSVLARIFDPFFTTKGQSKGTGLGLSVAHSIVKSHGGTITVDSHPGKGTTFKVFLPELEQQNLMAVSEISPSLRGGNECILYVDDEEDLVFAGKKMLERLGYEVVTGSDGLEAFRIFSAQPERFDLVITDQTMPHMTGEMLARKILEIRAGVPVILCSGRGSSTDAELCLQRAREIGIRELISKPFERAEMTEIIRRVLD